MNYKSSEKRISVLECEVSGAISVYLCLLFAVLVSLILIMYEAANYNAMKLHVECATDSAMDSCLAEYNAKLLDRYGLLFVDSGYGEAEGALDNVNRHIEFYMANNLDTNKELILASSKDLYGASVYRVDVLKTSRATDEDGAVFRYMAVSYMLEYYGIAYATELMDAYETSANTGLFDDVDDENNIDEMADSAFDALNDFTLSDEKKEEYGIDGDIEYEHPEKGVQQKRASGILKTVCKGDISGKTVDLSPYASHRSNTTGDGMYSAFEDRNELMSNALFNQYVVLMTGNYCDVKPGTPFDYELEYVIAGKDCDEANLKYVVNRLLLIRGIANTAYYNSDLNMVEEVEAAASLITLACGVPELEPLLEGAISIAWIYAESTVDVKRLMSGKKVSFVTNKDEWDTSLDNIIGGTFDDDDDEDKENNMPATAMEYKDYLGMILFLTGTKAKTYRMMDIVEMDMRSVCGEETFRLDNCMAAFEIQALVECNNGYCVLVKKSFGYQ